MAAFVASRDAEPVAASDAGEGSTDPWDLIGPVAW
jgi:hypothetical protein